MGQRTAIVCIARNEDRTVREWIDYHLKLGFDRIFMHQNDWTCEVEHERLTKLRFDGRCVQVPAYNRWLSSEHRKDFDWAAFIDCDEFIVLHKHNNISDFLSEFGHPVGVSPNWLIFGSCGQESPYPYPESLIKRFTFRGNKPDKHVKTILNLRSDAHMHTPHSPNRPTTDTRRNVFSGPFHENGPTDVIQLNHYFHKSKLEWSARVARGKISEHGTRPMEDWDQNAANFRDVRDLAALEFLYGDQKPKPSKIHKLL
jgi:hypothetical protein